MKICKDHWQTMRDAIEARGISGLIAKSGEAAIDDTVRQLEEAQATGEVSEKTTRDTFDPLMSMHWHFTNEALRCGGLYLMTNDPAANPDNDGEFCPVCEFVKHSQGFVASEAIGSVADQMLAYCREQGLVPKVS